MPFSRTTFLLAKCEMANSASPWAVMRLLNREMSFEHKCLIISTIQDRRRVASCLQTLYLAPIARLMRPSAKVAYIWLAYVVESLSLREHVQFLTNLERQEVQAPKRLGRKAEIRLKMYGDNHCVNAGVPSTIQDFNSLFVLETNLWTTGSPSKALVSSAKAKLHAFRHYLRLSLAPWRPRLRGEQ